MFLSFLYIAIFVNIFKLNNVFLFIVFIVLKQTLTSFYIVYIYHNMIFSDIAIICCYSIYIDTSLKISYILDIYNHLSTITTPFPLSGLLIKTSLLLRNLFKVLYIHKHFLLVYSIFIYGFTKYDKLAFTLPASLLYLMSFLLALCVK